MPPSTFTVLVDASGPAGGQRQGQRDWTLLLTLAAWRQAGQPVQTTPLRLERRISQATLDRLMKSIKPYALLSVKGRIGKGEVDAKTLLATSCRNGARDPELAAVAAELRRPVRLRDKVFGAIALNRAARWYEASATWRGRRVQVVLDADTPALRDQALAHARKIWAAQSRWTTRAQKLITTKVLAHANKVWRLEDEAPLTARALLLKLKLRSISVLPSGAFDLCYADGDVFGGHDLLLFGKSSGALNRWDLIG